jgi:hypothetical protein
MYKTHIKSGGKMPNMIFVFITGTLIGYYLSLVSHRISRIIKNFYEETDEKTSYIKLLFLEIKTFVKYFYRDCDNSDKEFINSFKHIFFSLILGAVYLTEYYYYRIFHWPLWGLIMFLFVFSLLYIGIVIDVLSYYIPEIFIFVPSLVLIIYYVQYDIKRVGYFFLIIIFGYLIYFLQKRFNKLLVGLQDIKLYAIGVLIFNIISLPSIIFVSNISVLPIMLYQFLINGKKNAPFGIYIYIVIVLYPFLLLHDLI